MSFLDLNQVDLPLTIETDVSKIRNNLLSVRKHISEDTKIIMVAKSSMYGLGTDAIGACTDLVDALAVHSLAAAYKLAEQGINKPIYILCPFILKWLKHINLLEQYPNIVPCVDSLYIAKQLVLTMKTTLNVAVKINLGLNRFGISPDELESIMKIFEHSCINVDSIYSHFPGTTSAPLDELKAREAKFLSIVKPYQGKGINFHVADSACAVRNIGTSLDFVRVGLLPIGIDPVDVEHDVIDGLSLCFKVSTRILNISDIKKGAQLGYQGTASQDRKIATIAGGYGHGLPRTALFKGHAMINDIKCPYLCKSFMEYSIIDITDCDASVGVGDEVTIIAEDCRPTQLGNYADETPEIFMTALSSSIERVFVNK